MSGPYDQQQLYAQAGGQFPGFGVGQFGSQLVGQPIGQFAGQFVAQPVNQTTTTSYQVQQQSSSSRGERPRRQRNDSSSSSSSSDAGYQAGSTQAVDATITQGASSSGSYAAAGGSYTAASGTYAAAGESFGSAVSGQRRPGRVQKQVIRLPDQYQGQVRQVRHRLPTPEPDTLERVYIQRAGQEIVEEITEIPTTPPPRVQERTVIEPAGPPQVIKKVIRVPPRSGGYQFQSQQGTTGSLLSAGSYGSVQQGSVPYQQYSGVATTNYGGFGSFGGGFQQQAFGFQSQPSYGASSNAYCFYA